MIWAHKAVAFLTLRPNPGLPWHANFGSLLFLIAVSGSVFGCERRVLGNLIPPLSDLLVLECLLECVAHLFDARLIVSREDQ